MVIFQSYGELTISRHNNHIVAYVKQQTIAAWKHITFKNDSGGQPAYFYGSNDCIHFTRLKLGDVLWVIQSHKGGPPSLIARLKIKDLFFDMVKRECLPEAIRWDFRKWQFLIQGDPDNCVFFGHNDATAALHELYFNSKRKFKDPESGEIKIVSPWQFEGRLTDEVKQWNPSEGIYLLHPCFIAPRDDKGSDAAGAQPLENLAASILANTVFISYKHDAFKRKKERDKITNLIRLLVQDRIAVWWDRYAIPGYKPKSRRPRTEEEHSRALNRILDQGLVQSRAIIGLVSQGYGDFSDKKKLTNWTLREWQAKDSRRILYEIEPKPEGTIKELEDKLEGLEDKLNRARHLLIANCDIREAVRKIRRNLAER